MRGIILLIAIAVFCLPVVANQEDEGVLPFAYVRWNSETRYDLFVMDAQSGEEMYSVIGEDHDCPHSISEDGNWLLYLQDFGASDTSIMSLSTGESLFIGELDASDVLGNHDFSKIAYTQREDMGDSHLYLYERSTGDNHLLLEDKGDEIELMRFVGDELLYVLLEEDEIIFNRWNGISLETQSFYRRDSHNISLNISPDGNFLNVLYRYNNLPNVLSIIDTMRRHGEDIQLPITDSIYSLDWLPDTYSFAYVGENQGVWFYDSVSGEIEEMLSYNTEEMWDLLYPDSEHIPNTSYRNLEWSPDGSHLLITVQAGNDRQILLLERSTGQIVNPNYWGAVDGVQWLSATEIVYSYSESGGSSGFEIVYYNASTGERRQLTSTDDIDEILYCVWG